MIKLFKKRILLSVTQPYFFFTLVINVIYLYHFIVVIIIIIIIIIIIMMIITFVFVPTVYFEMLSSVVLVSITCRCNNFNILCN